MKILALTVFRNEQHSLAAHLASLKPYVDGFVGLDHRSSDNSAAIFREVTGSPALSSPDTIREWRDGGEPNARQMLLEMGRDQGGTHFVVLDADECMTPAAGAFLREMAMQLESGSRMLMPWIILWKSSDVYRVGSTIWNMPYKDFVFADDPLLSYNFDRALHFPRTPTVATGSDIRTPQSLGGVLHYQFAFWDETQIKQAWYQCIELLEGKRSAVLINRTYRFSKEDSSAVVASVPPSWYPPTTPREPESVWRLNEIISWFDQYGIEHFEALDIWMNSQLLEEFRRRTGRQPKPRQSTLWSAMMSIMSRVGS